MEKKDDSSRKYFYFPVLFWGLSNTPNWSRFVCGIDDSTYRKLIGDLWADLEDIEPLSYVGLVDLFVTNRLPTVSIRHAGCRYAPDLENIAQLGYAG